MKYRSKHPTETLEFTLGKTSVKVPPGVVVEFDDKYHASIVAMGVLVEVVKDEPKAPEPPPSDPKPAPAQASKKRES